VFTAQYTLNPYIKQTWFILKGLTFTCPVHKLYKKYTKWGNYAKTFVRPHVSSWKPLK